MASGYDIDLTLFIDGERIGATGRQAWDQGRSMTVGGDEYFMRVSPKFDAPGRRDAWKP